MSEQDDVADTLPTEGSPYAIQEDALDIIHSFSNGNVNGTCRTSSYGLRFLRYIL